MLCRAQREHLQQKASEGEQRLQEAKADRKESERDRKMSEAVANMKKLFPGLCICCSHVVVFGLVAVATYIASAVLYTVNNISTPRHQC